MPGQCRKELLLRACVDVLNDVLIGGGVWVAMLPAPGVRMPTEMHAVHHVTNVLRGESACEGRRRRPRVCVFPQMACIVMDDRGDVWCLLDEIRQEEITLAEAFSSREILQVDDASIVRAHYQPPPLPI